ncbi:MAG: 30S ribosomal protein S5 [Planctomycetota bacterium]
MAEMMEKSGQLESHTAGIFRTAATVKGGRRFSFGAMVIVGDRRGKIGRGHAKSTEVPSAIEKAEKQARRSTMSVPLTGGTIPHQVEGRFLASRVRLIPASPGTGVIAGSSVRSILELVGVTDCLTKCYGSTNKINVIKAVFDALSQLRTRDAIAELRGVELGETDIEERITRAQRFMTGGGGAAAKGRVLTADDVRVETPEAKEAPAETETQQDAGAGTGGESPSGSEPTDVDPNSQNSPALDVDGDTKPDAETT